MVDRVYFASKNYDVPKPASYGPTPKACVLTAANKLTHGHGVLLAVSVNGARREIRVPPKWPSTSRMSSSATNDLWDGDPELRSRVLDLCS